MKKKSGKHNLKILSSQKRVWSKGLPIDSSCIPTLSLIFFCHLKGYSHAYNLKKQVSPFRAKKCGVLFDVELVVTYRISELASYLLAHMYNIKAISLPITISKSSAMF
jgi:hypothetical protein